MVIIGTENRSGGKSNGGGGAIGSSSDNKWGSESRTNSNVASDFCSRNSSGNNDDYEANSINCSFCGLPPSLEMSSSLSQIQRDVERELPRQRQSIDKVVAAS